MNIQKPFEREFFLFAPEIAEKQVQGKGKKKDLCDNNKRGGKIHLQK
jgi:hypothetical protein